MECARGFSSESCGRGTGGRRPRGRFLVGAGPFRGRRRVLKTTFWGSIRLCRGTRLWSPWRLCHSLKRQFGAANVVSAEHCTSHVATVVGAILSPPGANFSTCLPNSGDLRRTASCAEYVVQVSPNPATTSTIGLLIRLVSALDACPFYSLVCSPICLFLAPPKQAVRKCRRASHCVSGALAPNASPSVPVCNTYILPRYDFL